MLVTVCVKELLASVGIKIVVKDVVVRDAVPSDSTISRD